MNLNRIAIFVCALFILVTCVSVEAQETPLSMDELVTALNSTSSGLTLEEKNEFIATRVGERGVDFPASSENLSKLREAGGSPELITAIRQNAPTANQSEVTPSNQIKAPDASLKRLWVEKNFVKDGRTGLLVHANFTTYNLRGEKLQMTTRFKGPDGNFLSTANASYRNRAGQLALYKNLQPGHEAAEYADWSVFLPYSELPMGAGTYDIGIVADLIYANGNHIKNLGEINESVTKARPSLRAPKADFDSMWVEYGVQERNKLGMRIHVKMKVSNLKDVRCYMKVSFEERDGTPLVAKSTLYSDRAGHVSLYAPLRPATMSALYSDIAVFMPYEELNLKSGEYRLVMRSDLIYPDGGLISNLGRKGFRYTEK